MTTDLKVLTEKLNRVNADVAKKASVLRETSREYVDLKREQAEIKDAIRTLKTKPTRSGRQ